MTDVLTREVEAPAAGSAEAPSPVGEWAREHGAGVDLSDLAALALAAVTASAAIGSGACSTTVRSSRPSWSPSPSPTARPRRPPAAAQPRRHHAVVGRGAGGHRRVGRRAAHDQPTGCPAAPRGTRSPATSRGRGSASARWSPPAPVTRGFVLSAVIGTWAAAVAADSAAFRLGAPFEATIPSFTLFVFGAVLGADRHRVGYTVVYFAALLLFLLVHGSVRRSEQLSWFAGRTRGGARAIVQGGLALVAVAVVAAMVLGPGIPGAKSDAMISWRPQRDSGPSDRQTVSPLVDIRTRLVDQSEREVFTVVSSAPDYWRLTALERFDGQIWSSVGTYKPAEEKAAVRRGREGTAQGGAAALQHHRAVLDLAPGVFEPQALPNPRGCATTATPPACSPRRRPPTA